MQDIVIASAARTPSAMSASSSRAITCPAATRAPSSTSRATMRPPARKPISASRRGFTSPG